MANYSKKKLRKIIKEYSKSINRTPKMKDVACNKNLPPINQFLKLFKTWNNLLKECNLKHNSVGYYPKKHLIDSIIFLTKELGRVPTIEDIKKNKNLPSPGVYFKRFGSWNNALREKKLSINVRKDYTKSELLRLLNKKAKEFGRSPKSSEMNQDPNMPDMSTYNAHFGSWNNALKSAGLKINHEYRKWKKEELLEWLIKKAKELDRTPRTKDFDKDPKAPAKNQVVKSFGSWNNALREANLPVRWARTKEELIEILHKLSMELKRTPTREEIKSMKRCIKSYTPFVEKFGSYTAACLMAGLTPNDGRNNKIWKGWQKHCEDIARVIYGKIEFQKNTCNGRPDICIQRKRLFIDAKTCGYKDFKGQIKKYCKNNYKLEFWLIFRGIETKNKEVKYVYAEELAQKMKRVGEEDLAAKCYQFIKNIFDESQKVLTDTKFTSKTI